MQQDFEDIFDVDDLDPDELRHLVHETLRTNRSIDSSEIAVHVQSGKVILAGRVGTDAEKRIAERVVADRIGLTNLESQLVVDPLHRAVNPDAADENVNEEEQDDGLLLGDGPRSHAEDDLFGTVDRTEAIEDGIPWIPPESPTPEGTDEPGFPPRGAELDSF
ncbi:MAG: BON domain-containing protein [Gemmatimonadaceae bacterium]